MIGAVKMKSFLKLYLLTALLAGYFLQPQEANAKNYYVAKTGNDNNHGSLLSPFKTVTKLLNIIQPGDIGHIRKGTYALNQYTKRSGTKTHPITIEAYLKSCFPG
jgi:hypothetical protein